MLQNIGMVKIREWYKATTTSSNAKKDKPENKRRQKVRDKVLKRVGTSIGTVRVALSRGSASEAWISRMCDAIDKVGV